MTALTTRQPSKGRASKWLTPMQPYISGIPCPKSLTWLTEMAGPDGAGRSLVNSVALTLIARIAMVIAAGALPVAGWMLQRGVNSIDDVSRKIDTMRDQAFETNGTVKLIQQMQAAQTRVIEDHELRIRGAESAIRSIPFRAN